MGPHVRPLAGPLQALKPRPASSQGQKQRPAGTRGRSRQCQAVGTVLLGAEEGLSLRAWKVRV